MSIPYRHIAVEGGIGAGKSTLATALANRLGTGPLLEPFADNPLALPARHTVDCRRGLFFELHHGS